MKRSLVGLLFVFALGCGGGGAPTPASYCGDMPDSGNYDLFGRVVIIIANDNRVLGTLENGGRRFEIRGELQSSGAFSGVLDGPVDFNISGSIISQDDDRAYASWTIDGDGDENDAVSFSLGKC